MRTCRAVFSVLVISGAMGICSAPALALSEGPGWELAAATYPTNLVHGVNEVQEVITSSKAATFTLGFEGETTAPILFGAEASTVQSALEGLSSVGAGNVSVSEGATTGTYIVTFDGALGNMKVATLAVSSGSVEVTTLGAASGTIGIDVFNIGAGASSGTITITDALPPGVKAKEAGRLVEPGQGSEGFGVDPQIVSGVWDCTGNGPGAAPGVNGATIVTCTNDPIGLPEFQGGGGLPTFGPSVANPQPAVGIAVEASTEESGLTNHASIEGGGATTSASTTDPVTVSSVPAKGGLTQADAWFSNANGTVDAQAGSHPYTTTFVFNVATAVNKDKEVFLPESEIRDLETQLPPGFIGDLHGFAECTRGQLLAEECPSASMVGTLRGSAPGFQSAQKQVFNMVPAPGQPAELGFEYSNVPVFIKFTVRTGGDYGFVAHVIVPARIIYQTILTLWGVPAEKSHNRWRAKEGGCSKADMTNRELVGADEVDYCIPLQGPVIAPVLTLPTSCGAPQPFALREVDGWQEPAAKSEIRFDTHDSNGNPVGFTGCGALGLEPAFSAVTDTARADSPSGLTAKVIPPLGGLEEPEGLASADLENTTVTLPEGLVVNPGQAAGLQTCPAGRPSPGVYGNALTTETEASEGKEDDEAASCPEASRVGTVTIKSPLIEAASEKQFDGNIYVLPSNPPEIKLLLAASADGVNLKLVGTAHLNEQTGRVETKFEDTPPLPFTDLKLAFNGGSHAALDTPTHCGVFTTSADFSPWSAPSSADAFESPEFSITEGASGASCAPSPMPFSPTFTAGSTNDQAGAFTSFTTLLQRGDGQQRVEKLQFKAPLGLAGMISSVPLCPEPLAQLGTCAASSQIGHAVVTAGAGSNPLTIPQPGEPVPAIYLTGPYSGAPFGLSIVTPVIAGPFNLGTIVTRAKIEIDPHTAQVTITTDPLPQIVKGVPSDLRSIEAVIDRPGFMFNPSSCQPQSMTGTAMGIAPPGASETSQTAALSSRFAVGACRTLAFTPKVSISTSAQASKKNGASLKFKIAYPKGAMGSQAWFHAAKFIIPKQLPARLGTIQQACDSVTFATDRAACSPHSVIGRAVVHTPVLPVPLEGPIYFVSQRNERFPEAVMVLSGDNVNIELPGETLIHAGVTSATFRDLPDVPFETIEVTLPTGRYSEFAPNLPTRYHDNFCRVKLSMATALVGQNGLEIHQSTPVQVAGCPKLHKKVKHAKHTKAKRGH